MLSAKTHPPGEASLYFIHTAADLYRKRGPQYHLVVELFRRLKLPVYDGVHRALEDFNELRMKTENEKVGA